MLSKKQGELEENQDSTRHSTNRQVRVRNTGCQRNWEGKNLTRSRRNLGTADRSTLSNGNLYITPLIDMTAVAVAPSPRYYHDCICVRQEQVLSRRRTRNAFCEFKHIDDVRVRLRGKARRDDGCDDRRWTTNEAGIQVDAVSDDTRIHVKLTSSTGRGLSSLSWNLR